MRAAVLDACVLANFSLCDTLLRLAEAPRLFDPKWSDEILLETTRTLEVKLKWPPSLVTYFEAELPANFSEAWVCGYATGRSLDDLLEIFRATVPAFVQEVRRVSE